MAKSHKQKSRILILARIFREETDENHGLSLAQLEAHLSEYGVESERKTMYNDIEALRRYGMDIVADKQARNTTYFLASREFELPELYLLANAVASSKFISKRKSVKLIRKISALAGKYEEKKLMRQITVTDRVKTTNESIYYTINDINEAISDGKKISFLYFNYDEKKRKVYHNNKQPLVISPRALVWKDENYYVTGYYDKRRKHADFRADKMEKIRILNEKSYKDPEFDVSDHCNRRFSMYGGRRTNVKLRFDNSLAGVVIDRFGLSTHFTDMGSSFEIEADIDVSPTFYGWLFQFGSNAQIVGPPGVRNEFKLFTEEILKQYTHKPGSHKGFNEDLHYSPSTAE